VLVARLDSVGKMRPVRLSGASVPTSILRLNSSCNRRILPVSSEMTSQIFA